MAQPYCSVADVLSKPFLKVVTDTGWDLTSASPDILPLIQEGASAIDGVLGKLGYSLPFATNPDCIRQANIAYARWAILRDAFTGDAPSQAASSSMKVNKDRYDAMMGELLSGSASLVDASGAVIPRSENNVLTAPYPKDSGIPADMYPNFPAGPYPENYDNSKPLEDC